MDMDPLVIGLGGLDKQWAGSGPNRLGRGISWPSIEYKWASRNNERGSNILRTKAISKLSPPPNTILPPQIPSL